MPTSYEKLSALLKELFQLDQADLDFGIYRIMNQKRDEISRFLDAELLPQVKTAFEQYHPADKKVLDEKIEQARKSAIEAGFDPEQSPRVKELRDQQATYSVDTEGLENEVYSHLYSFFRRYYDNGDFISMRRYKEGVYAIPYEGEEVKLHWANADQYYVKTTENFRDYSFRLPSGRFAHFKIVEAETEKDNVKADAEKERRFILAPEAPIAVDGDALILRFEYRADPEKRDQKTLNTLAAETILAGVPAEWVADIKTLAPTESNPKRSLLEKHLADYSARNTFDYFIHKDLRSFLRRELDFYIKNEVMHLDDIEDEGAPQVEQYLSKIKVLRQIAHKIIEFLAQIEDFQKKLWLKKKFVVETNYCITLDRVPEALYPEICANDAQREEWVRLVAIDEITGKQPPQPELGAVPKPGYSVPMTIEFLKANPFLVLDTKYFDQAFIDQLLASLEDMDTQADGLLIHSENFQAMNLLQNQYRGLIKAIYIDPPYNRKDDDFLYKDNFKHSTWLSMISDRAQLGMDFLKKDGSLFISIDDDEFELLGTLVRELFGKDQFITNLVWEKKKKGTFLSNFITSVKEYVLLVAKSRNDFPGLIGQIITEEETYPCVNASNPRDIRRIPAGIKSKFREPNYQLPAESVISAGNMNIKLLSNLELSNGVLQNELVVEGNWRYSQESMEKYALDGTLYITQDLYLRRIVSEPRRKTLKDILLRTGDGEQDFRQINIKDLNEFGWGSNEDANQELLDLFNKQYIFNYPKPTKLIAKLFASIQTQNEIFMDFFAGSGTTSEAVLRLNRLDNGTRKYFLIEMGSYFNDVILPRVKKAIYSSSWDRGKPQITDSISQLVKYLRLESYEDTLNNLTLQRTHEQQLAFEANPEFKENYMLSYMLDVESKGSLLNIQSFVHPFDYQLNIASGTVGESQPTRVDLVETFNYLIGLHVETLQSIRGFRVVSGKNPAGERTLIIWRDLEEKSNKDLEEFFRKQDYNPRDMEYDLIYVNGDNNLENIRRPDETWKVRLIEEEFVRLMFDTESN